MVRANEANWDARTPVHVASEFYGLDGSRSAEDWFAPFEWADLGDLTGREVLHLQCHLGTETAAFAERGAAHTVGLDISAAAVAEARRLADEGGRDVEFVRADVHRAVEALGGRRFDVIYTGKGALCYLPDLTAWAGIVSALLRPGGTCYLVEFHPLLDALGPKPSPNRQQLLLEYDYLGGRGPIRSDTPDTYTDGPPVQGATVSYEWRHGVGEVISALVGAGLAVQLVRETELLPWKRFDSMVPADNGWWRLPESEPIIPLLYAVRAVKGGKG
ncbi:class I SAM-dependent methyltransferase [Streptomyces halobius]|uniref:Class I SAM-dependent methyltransferase n=2 Tax=Streptomyces halobius TaxID=2879846 RepID=A0ABY4MKG3_9ACTN|nr:class I SAM-dependent methyltransferase [Streptomyces halobius]UQA97667.1 class I SAM-dependent methyltransferase [Streptomyces halobius]